MMYGLVVARYNEDISWIDEIDLNKIKVYLYNKGPKIEHIRKGIYYEEIPNVGRESETYLYHIEKNYHDLDEKIVFTQGRFKDHCGSIQNLLRMYDSTPWGSHRYEKNFRLDVYCTKLEKERDNLNFSQWMDKYVEVLKSNTIRLKYNGIFGVSKNKILSRKLEYYKDTLRPQLQSFNPEVGHYFERAWFYIFNLHQ